jgi:hypothetical protein
LIYLPWPKNRCLEPAHHLLSERRGLVCVVPRSPWRWITVKELETRLGEQSRRYHCNANHPSIKAISIITMLMTPLRAFANK